MNLGEEGVQPGKTEYVDDTRGWLTTVTVFSSGRLYSCDEGQGQLQTLLSSLTDIQMKIPQTYRATAAYCLEVESDGYEDSLHYAVFEVYYKRPATEKEIAAAQAVRLSKQAEHDAWQYQQYQMLKQKFRGM